MSKSFARGRFLFGVVATAGIACFVCALLVAWKSDWLKPRIALSGNSVEPTELFARTFDGSSTDLRQTVIVSTLDTPIPDGKSAIWCSSFQLAWNRLKAGVVGGPIQ